MQEAAGRWAQAGRRLQAGGSSGQAAGRQVPGTHQEAWANQEAPALICPPSAGEEQCPAPPVVLSSVIHTMRALALS